MLKAVKSIGLLFVWILALVVLWMLGLLLIKGGVWLSERITPWLFSISWGVLAFAFLGFLPLCASKETRGVGGLGLHISSYAFGATLWFWSLLLTYTTWGWIAVIIGLLIAGVGVLPIALLATAFKGEWAIFGQLLLLTVATFGARFLGIHFMVRHEQEPGEPGMPVKLIVATWLLFAGSFAGGFIPYGAYVSLGLFLICAIVLLFSKTPRARKHGKVALATIAAIWAILLAIGFIFAEKFTRPN
jgi:hypothetical protein